MLLSARPWTPQEIHRVAPRPSPLSERPVMVINPAFSPTCTMHSRPESSQPFCKRIVKPNPLVRSPDAAKERRRGMFFKRVQQDREDRKWELRAEQIERLDFISSKRRWEAEKAQQALSLDDDELAEDSAGHQASSFASNGKLMTEEELQEADAILQREKQELEALINSMNEESQLQYSAPQGESNEEDDYDRFFREYLADPDLGDPPAPNAIWNTDEDAMDMTDG